MVAVVFQIPTMPVPTGTSSSPWRDITSQLAGHNSYTVAIDVSAWQPSDTVTILIQFRADGGATVDGCKITTTGGPHTDIQGNPVLPSCSELFSSLPTFTTKLEARATVTVPFAGSVSGSITLN